MDAPLLPLGLIGHGTALVGALACGAAFGLLLERAGFGDPRRIAAQFYGTDLRVLKLMFTALVTALVGVLVLERLGWIDRDLVVIPPTHPAANLLGGALIGLGLIIGGFCPGTALVGAASLRPDAGWCVAGLALGVALYAGLDPVLAGLLGTGAARSTLDQVLGVPPGWIALGVTAMAIGAFLAAEALELRLGGRSRAHQDLLGGAHRHRARLLMALLIATAALLAGAGVQPSAARSSVSTAALADLMTRQPPRIPVDTVADALHTGTWTTRILDVTPRQAHPVAVLPGSERIPLDALGTLACDRDRPVLLVAQDGHDADRAWVVLQARGISQATVLDGGLPAWDERILRPILATLPSGGSATASHDLAQDNLRRALRARHFGGSPRFAPAAPVSPAPAPPAPAAPAPVQPPARTGSGGC